MSDMMEYKCPACGGALEFDSASQRMKCPYCDSEYDISVFETQHADTAANKGSGANEQWKAESSGEWQPGETDGMRVYACQSCGGEIVADESTGATTCPYCGNNVVMKGQFEGDKRPDKIIPFKLDKKAAKQAYLAHLKGKLFLPSVFKQQNHIDEIKAVYVPFWLLNADAEADIDYDATRIHVWEKGDTEYTETEYFDLHRQGSVSFQNVPTDCSRKMDDALMESIEPFYYQDLQPFSPAFLAGYLADRYDVSLEECMRRARVRIKKSVEDSFAKTASAYQTVRARQTSMSMMNTTYSYVLLPVWILNTTWKGQNFIFAMNGQTGKMVGDLPMDKTAFGIYLLSRSVIFSIICMIISFLIF